MKIPSPEQVQQMVRYLTEQAAFHRWQAANRSSDPQQKAEYFRRATFCEGWSMALPELVEAAQKGEALKAAVIPAGFFVPK